MSMLTMARLIAACLLFIGHIHFIELAPTESYPYSDALASNYMLYWKYNDTHITFETHVQTRGSVGLGISTNGSMFPGDVAVGWVSQNKGYLFDMHTTGHIPPVMDKTQDWVLIDSMATNDETVLKFSRALNTNDVNDIPIHSGVTHVIWEYTTTLPQQQSDPVYHGTNRGSKDIKLINTSPVVGR